MTLFQENLKTIGEYGVITELRYPLVTINGLPLVRAREILYFEKGAIGEVYSITPDYVEAVLLTNDPVFIGEQVARSGNFLKIPISSSLLGSVITPIGESYGSLSNNFKPEKSVEVEHKPLGIEYRESIRESLHSGVMLVDLLLPLGKGQKQLVIGDRKTGKTTFLLTLMKNQIAQGAIVIYGAIARKQRDIKQLIEFINKENLSENVVIVATTSFDSPGLIFLTPFTAMTIAEYFRDQGHHVVVIFDDLTSHAKFYREISLIASRFPGRESYPGDIFFTHARIMERAGNFKVNQTIKGSDSQKTVVEKSAVGNSEAQNIRQSANVKIDPTNSPTIREVSISCFPVVETTEADLTSYIATNIMAMTDGHIFFDQGTFAKGRRPAINIGLSVTRVGRQAQTPLKRDINQKLIRLLSEYEQMSNLAHFGAELSGKVQKTLNLGETIYELLNQSNHTPIREEVQLILIALVWGGEIDTNQLDELKERMNAAGKVETDRNFMLTLVKADTLYDLSLNLKKNKKELFELIGMPLPEAVEKFETQKIITLSDSIRTTSQGEHGQPIPINNVEQKKVVQQPNAPANTRLENTILPNQSIGQTPINTSSAPTTTNFATNKPVGDEIAISSKPAEQENTKSEVEKLEKKS